MKSKTNLIITLFILLGVLTRLIPHADNFTAVYAIALFAGACFNNKKTALLIPICIMIISDFLLGQNMVLSVYISFMLIVLLGFFLKQKDHFSHITSFAIVASLIFFFTTNFAVWLSSSPADGIYYCPMNLEGLIKCYTQAIPFFWNTLFSTTTYSIILFYSFKVVQNQVAIKSK